MIRHHYFCGRYGRRDEFQGYARQVVDLGHSVVSSWLSGPPEDEGRETTEWKARAATQDIADLMKSDTVLAFTELPGSPHGRGGRHVELGIALSTMYHDIYVIGPRENVFCCLPQIKQLDSFEHYLNLLKEGL